MCAALTDCYSLRSYASVSFLICTRRHLKWPSAEYRDSHHHDAACDWNTALVSQALPHALYHTVMYAIQHRYNACDVMKLFPDPALALTHWDKLIPAFYRQVEPEAIFYTKESGGSGCWSLGKRSRNSMKASWKSRINDGNRWRRLEDQS